MQLEDVKTLGSNDFSSDIEWLTNFLSLKIEFTVESKSCVIESCLASLEKDFCDGVRWKDFLQWILLFLEDKDNESHFRSLISRWYRIHFSFGNNIEINCLEMAFALITIFEKELGVEVKNAANEFIAFNEDYDARARVKSI
jgi:hypothetical protein